MSTTVYVEPDIYLVIFGYIYLILIHFGILGHNCINFVIRPSDYVLMYMLIIMLNIIITSLKIIY